MKNDDKTAITSYSDRCLDDGTMLIAHDLEILVLVVEQGIRLADLDGRVRVGFAAQLLEELVDVIVVDVAAAACEMAVMMRMPDRSRSRSAPPRVARAPNAMSRSAMARLAASSPGSTPAAGRGSPMCRDDAPCLIVVRLSHAAGVRAVRYRRASIPRRPAYGRLTSSRC